LLKRRLGKSNSVADALSRRSNLFFIMIVEVIGLF